MVGSGIKLEALVNDLEVQLGETFGLELWDLANWLVAL